MGVPFALVMTLFNIFEGEDFRWLSFLLLMFVFGGLMSLTLVTIHLMKLRQAGIKNFTPESVKVFHKKDITTTLSKEDLVNKLKHDGDFRWRKFIQKENEIIIHTASSFWSWGEKIIIRLDKSENGLYHYSVTSTPSARTTIVDFGRNLSNMLKLEKMLAH